MNDEKKYPLPIVRAAIESYEHIEFTDEEWETGLFGWRKQRRKKLRKKWLNQKEVTSLVKYFTHPYILIEFGKKGFFIF